MPRWVFIRHGESVANREAWLSGQRDVPLSELGRSQAHQAALELQEFDFSHAFASDLQRARDTARIVLAKRAIPLQEVSELRERSCGQFEGTGYSEASKSGLAELLHAFDGCPDGGESLRDTAIRALKFLSQLTDMDEGSLILIASHGALMRAVLGVLDGTPKNEISDWRPRNCEWVEREVSHFQWVEVFSRLVDDCV